MLRRRKKRPSVVFLQQSNRAPAGHDERHSAGPGQSSTALGARRAATAAFFAFSRRYAFGLEAGAFWCGTPSEPG